MYYTKIQFYDNNAKSYIKITTKCNDLIDFMADSISISVAFIYSIYCIW